MCRVILQRMSTAVVSQNTCAQAIFCSEKVSGFVERHKQIWQINITHDWSNLHHFSAPKWFFNLKVPQSWKTPRGARCHLIGVVVPWRNFTFQNVRSSSLDQLIQIFWTSHVHGNFPEKWHWNTSVLGPFQAIVFCMLLEILQRMPPCYEFHHDHNWLAMHMRAFCERDVDSHRVFWCLASLIWSLGSSPQGMLRCSQCPHISWSCRSGGQRSFSDSEIGHAEVLGSSIQVDRIKRRLDD